MTLLRFTCARPWVLAAAVCLLASCTGPSGPAYFAQHPNDVGPVVRVWEVRLSGPLRYVATHLILEVRGAEDPAGHGETWEVFQFEDLSEPDHGHIHVFRPREDRATIGSRDHLVAEVRGERAARAVAWIREHAPAYRYRHRYVACPGPNSNTFVATLIRDCPDLAVDLPPTAVGKDFAGWLRIGGTTTKTGVQVTTPVLGAQVGIEEGVEIQLLGSCLIGVDFLPPAIKLAFVGRVGFPETARQRHDDADD
jgi:hypothetical protein